MVENAHAFSFESHDHAHCHHHYLKIRCCSLRTTSKLFLKTFGKFVEFTEFAEIAARFCVWLGGCARECVRLLALWGLNSRKLVHQ